MSTKKEKKENQVAKAPKWGTQEWVTAYPWSKMDKDRRRRVRKALGDIDITAPTGGTAHDYVDSLLEGLKAAKVVVATSVIKDVYKAADKVDNFMVCVRDVLVAAALYRCWGLPMNKGGKICDSKKSCDTCTANVEPCKKPCKKPCKELCKKSCKEKKA